MTEISLSPGTLWFILGVVLLVVEGMHGGVLAVFFALGAWVTAISLWLGIREAFGLQLAIFLIVSVLSLVLLRRKLKSLLTGLRNPAGDTDAALDDFAGKLATVIEPIDPHKNTGKVEYRGTTWAARAEVSIPSGAAVRIVARDNITLAVKPNVEAPES
jgi:hypothetical protein